MRNTTRFLCLLAAILMMLCAASASGAEGKTAEVRVVCESEDGRVLDETLIILPADSELTLRARPMDGWLPVGRDSASVAVDIHGHAEPDRVVFVYRAMKLDAPAPAPAYGIVQTPNGRPVNVRSQPKTVADAPARLPDGTVCLVLASAESFGTTWHRVRFLDGDGTGEGWISGDYFRLLSPEEAAAQAPAIPVGEGDAAANLFLYYNPNGGTRYHLDRMCPSVDGDSLPLPGVFVYCELDGSAYRRLTPCTVCGAPARP